MIQGTPLFRVNFYENDTIKAIFPLNNHIVSVGEKKICYWELSTQKLLYSYEIPERYDYIIDAIIINNRLYLAMINSCIRVFQLPELSPLTNLGEHQGLRKLGAWNNALLSLSLGDGLIVWDIHSQKQTKLIKLEDFRSAESLTTHHDRAYIGFSSGEMLVYDLKNLKPVQKTHHHHTEINDIKISPLCGISGSFSDSVVIWDLNTFLAKKKLRYGGLPGFGSSIDVNNAHFIVGHANNKLRVYDLTTCECLFLGTAHKSSIKVVRFGSKYFFSGDEDGNIMIWDYSWKLNQSV